MRERLNGTQMTGLRDRLRATWSKHKPLTGLGTIKHLTAKPAKEIALAVDILRVMEDTKTLDACLIMASLEHPKKWFSKVKTRLHVALLEVSETDLQLNEDTMPDKWKSLVLKLVPGPSPIPDGEHDESSVNDKFEDSFAESESETATRKARAAKRAHRTSFEWERKGVQEYDATRWPCAVHSPTNPTWFSLKLLLMLSRDLHHCR